MKLKINLEKYPFLPVLSFSSSLSKIITEREFTREEIIKNWETENPPHIYELIERICDDVSSRVKINRLKEDSQYLVLDRVTLGDITDQLSFKIHRGKSIGFKIEKKNNGKRDKRATVSPSQVEDLSNWEARILYVVKTRDTDPKFILFEKEAFDRLYHIWQGKTKGYTINFPDKWQENIENEDGCDIYNDLDSLIDSLVDFFQKPLGDNLETKQLSS